MPKLRETDGKGWLKAAEGESADMSRRQRDHLRPHWQRQLIAAVRDPAELCQLLALPQRVVAEAEEAAASFGLLVPRPYLARIPPREPDHPLLRQVLPKPEELVHAAGYSADPLGEADLCQSAVLRKYEGRALIITTGVCGIHCRFCFRRHFPYWLTEDRTCHTARRMDETLPHPGTGSGATCAGPATSDTSCAPPATFYAIPEAPCSTVEIPCLASTFAAALRLVALDQTIREVILSGGDPLVLPDGLLARLIRQLARVPHLQRLRIHTRLPVVIPERVTRALVRCLRATRLTTLVVVHVNHPLEIDAAVARGFSRLIDAGIPVLNQGVLLRGVNDSPTVLAELCERLVNLRVLPYYLHQLDAVAGAAHFAVSPDEGQEIVRRLRRCLPGYAVPRYVREFPQGECKELLA